MPRSGGYAGGRKDFTVHKVNADPIIRYRKDRKEIERKKERERLLRELFRDLIISNLILIDSLLYCLMNFGGFFYRLRGGIYRSIAFRFISEEMNHTIHRTRIKREMKYGENLREDVGSYRWKSITLKLYLPEPIVMRSFSCEDSFRTNPSS